MAKVKGTKKIMTLSIRRSFVEIFSILIQSFTLKLKVWLSAKKRRCQSPEEDDMAPSKSMSQSDRTYAGPLT